MLLATYNVLADAYLRAEWYRAVSPELLVPARRRAALLARVAGLGADVLCLQEVDEDCATALTEALRALGYDGAWRPKGHDKPDGCATFFRGATLSSTALHAYEDGSGHVALALRLAFAKGELLVVNTHLKWDDPKKPSAERSCVKQAESLARYVSAQPGDVVVCGDLNVTASDATLARLTQASLRDVFDGADEPHTCCSNGRTQKIDHVLVRGALDARPAPRLQASIAGVLALPSQSEPSDHVPLVVALTWS